MLDEEIKKYVRVLKPKANGLDRLGISSVRDLLYFFPKRVVQNIEYIKNETEQNNVSVIGILSKLEIRKTYRQKTPVAKAKLITEQGNIDLIWFHQPYIAKQFKDGESVRISGKINDKGTIINGDVKREEIEIFAQSGSITPIYRETRGVSSKWLREVVYKILQSAEIDDPIPVEIREKLNLPDRKTAFKWMHEQKTENQYMAAKKRFSFEEIFILQVDREQKTIERNDAHGYKIKTTKKDTKEFLKRFPFSPTKAQINSIEDIQKDIGKDRPMARLLEGDVGSGKTAVAAAILYSIVSTKPEKQDFGFLQVAYMAPTEILAKQQFETIKSLLKDLPYPVALITSKECRKFPSKVDKNKDTTISPAQAKKWIENGEIAAVVGTHALIQKSVGFRHLALVIIDEQHRFGVIQRIKLQRKNDSIPHSLSMTATPIPRTLALSIYGDLDISTLDELPAGRKLPETKSIHPREINVAYEKIREEIKKGRQVYVIAPRIEKDKEDKLSSVEQETEILRKEFPDLKVTPLHGRQKKEKIDETILAFRNKEIDILVTTTVVEVGVNVENANVMIIKNAERFGLAQLHQLRGRISRATFTPYCFVVSEKNTERLEYFEKIRDGFKLAEIDLKLRGTGQLSGIKQSGVSDLAMEALTNQKLVIFAREAAKETVKKDPTLKNSPVLKREIKERFGVGVAE